MTKIPVTLKLNNYGQLKKDYFVRIIHTAHPIYKGYEGRIFNIVSQQEDIQPFLAQVECVGRLPLSDVVDRFDDIIFRADPDREGKRREFTLKQLSCLPDPLMFCIDMILLKDIRENTEVTFFIFKKVSQ